MRHASRILLLVCGLLAGIAGPARAEDPCLHPAPSFTDPGAQSAPVNDPFFGRQWGLEQIHAPAAWAKGARGAGVTVAVIDSGLDRSHPEFAGKVLAGGGDFVGATDSGCAGPEDEEGHGTHVAGIIGAVTGNATGGAGVAPDAVVLPERVADASGVYEDPDLVEGIDAAVRSGARVINMSVGSGTSQTLAGSQLAPAVEQAVTRAVDAGIVVVAAAGNLSQPLCNYPSQVRGVICVAATDRDERPSFYSNLPNDPDGTAVDGTTPVRAPGGAATPSADPCEDETVAAPVNVLSTVLPGSPSDLCPGLRGYESLAGTSMAAPHVAGVAAILVGAGLSAAEVRACLRTTSRQPTGARGGFTPAYGYGIVDAEAALATCAPDFKPPPAASPSPAPGAAPAPGAKVRPALPTFARTRRVRGDRRGLTVSLSCRSNAACSGVLSIRAGRKLVARAPVAIAARRTLAIRLRWRSKAPRARRLHARIEGGGRKVTATLRLR